METLHQQPPWFQVYHLEQLTTYSKVTKFDDSIQTTGRDCDAVVEDITVNIIKRSAEKELLTSLE